MPPPSLGSSDGNCCGLLLGMRFALAREWSSLPRRITRVPMAPEETVLYQAIAAHWSEFRERGGPPQYVICEFEDYLDCGRLEAGCLLLECRSCG